MQKFIILALVSMFTINSLAQNDSLIIFTKYNCSNCIYIKNKLSENLLNFKEYPLEQNGNPKRMLRRLYQIGYKDAIYLPVIFLNKTMLYPANKSNGGFIQISLDSTIRHLSSLKQNNQIDLKYFENPIARNINLAANSNTCEHEIARIYLVHQNLKSKKEAEFLLSKFQDLGYTNAGIIYHQNYFRVYSKFFFDPTIAENELKHQRLNSKMIYLLTIKK